MFYLNNFKLILRFLGVGAVVFAIYWFHFKPIAELKDELNRKQTEIIGKTKEIQILELKLNTQKVECKQQNLSEFLEGMGDENETDINIDLLNLHT